MRARWRFALWIPLFAAALGGCTAMQATLPAPPDDPDFSWAAAGRLDNGCVFYIKRPRRPDVLVDQALWYQRADGSMTADAEECASR